MCYLPNKKRKVCVRYGKFRALPVSFCGVWRLQNELRLVSKNGLKVEGKKKKIAKICAYLLPRFDVTVLGSSVSVYMSQRSLRY